MLLDRTHAGFNHSHIVNPNSMEECCILTMNSVTALMTPHNIASPYSTEELQTPVHSNPSNMKNARLVYVWQKSRVW
jgi:hypothetical protein